MADKNIRRIFVCRHGKTEANESGIWCGGKNESPLTEIGKRQIKLLGNALKNYYHFCGKFIISSPRKRAKETAKIISENMETPPLVIPAEGLTEIDVGVWDGKTAEEVKQLLPEEFEEWQEGHLKPTFRFTGGESMEEAQKRIRVCFNTIKLAWLNNTRKDNQDIIMVAHGGTNVMILAEIASAEMKTFDYRAFRQDNACVNIIAFREKNSWRPETEIVLMNSTHHLDIDLKKYKGEICK